MPNSESRFRVGGVPYRVGAPLLPGLEAVPEVAFCRKPPRELAAELRCGELDAALVSSIEAFRAPGYFAMQDIGIACDGAVRSVRLFLRTDPADVKTLALDSGSATSVALSRILLVRRYGAAIEREFLIEPTRDPDAIDADAVLLIGDAGFEAISSRLILDLGTEWHRWKQLPFVFAIWLMRPRQDSVAVGAGVPDDLALLATVLRAAWARGKDEGVDDGTGGLIRYELGRDYREALGAFRDEALGLGLCETGVEPVWFGP